jgi:alkylhydroperoxidase/carboxymuconolactone decarboxylase family protein YurZ
MIVAGLHYIIRSTDRVNRNLSLRAILKLHVKGALKNGLTKDEIKEILLQVAVYCGIPSGIDAFRNAREAFKEVEGQ